MGSSSLIEGGGSPEVTSEASLVEKGKSVLSPRDFVKIAERSVTWYEHCETRNQKGSTVSLI